MMKIWKGSAKIRTTNKTCGPSENDHKKWYSELEILEMYDQVNREENAKKKELPIEQHNKIHILLCVTTTTNTTLSRNVKENYDKRTISFTVTKELRLEKELN